MRREFDKNYLSLLHFDFPYFAEPGDGCRDEINLMHWERVGGVKFCGSEFPNDETFTPKFGYRCLKTTDATSYLLGSGNTEIFNMKTGQNYVIECFVYTKGDGNILVLYSGSSAKLTIKIASSKLQLVQGSTTITGTDTIALNRWQHIAVKFSGTTIKFYMNGLENGSGLFEDSLSGISSVRLGGFNGYIDEFLYSTKNTVTTPDEPYKGVLDFALMGGTGDSKHGAANYTAANENLIINTCANIKTITSPTVFTYENLKTNTHGDFTAGDEILLITRTGLYSFRHVKSKSGNTITLDSAVTEFDFKLNNEAINIIKVPNYVSFTLGANVILRPCEGFGLVVFRVAGDCTINGKILTHGRYLAREDSFIMCNADLPERFLMNTNGGVMIICGGTFTASANARIGGDYSGDNTGGVGAKKSNGTNGGAGYGGGGSSCKQSHTTHIGGSGGVGGGGGAARLANSGNAGTSGTGGYSRGHGKRNGTGEIQGLTTGGASPSTGLGGYQNNPYDSGGGGTFGNSAGANAINGGLAGACVLIACKKLSCDSAAISTGGLGGISKGARAYSGDETGLCYIACEDMI